MAIFTVHLSLQSLKCTLFAGNLYETYQSSCHSCSSVFFAVLISQERYIPLEYTLAFGISVALICLRVKRLTGSSSIDRLPKNLVLAETAMTVVSTFLSLGDKLSCGSYGLLKPDGWSSKKKKNPWEGKIVKYLSLCTQQTSCKTCKGRDTDSLFRRRRFFKVTSFLLLFTFNSCDLAVRVG